MGPTAPAIERLTNRRINREGGQRSGPPLKHAVVEFRCCGMLYAAGHRVNYDILLTIINLDIDINCPSLTASAPVIV